MSGFTLGKALEMGAQFLDGRLQPSFSNSRDTIGNVMAPSPSAAFRNWNCEHSMAAWQTLLNHLFTFLVIVFDGYNQCNGICGGNSSTMIEIEFQASTKKTL